MHDVPEGLPPFEQKVLGQAFVLLDLDHKHRYDQLTRVEQPPCDHSKLSSQFIGLLQAEEAQEWPLFSQMANYRADLRLFSWLGSKQPRPKLVDYQAQVDIDRLLLMIDRQSGSEPGWRDHQRLEGGQSKTEQRAPFMEFLKKKTFEEFRGNQLLENSIKTAQEQEVIVQKTPVGPWGDGRGNGNAQHQTASESRWGPAPQDQARQNGNKGLAGFFSKEHHTNVINKYGGFSSGMDELKKVRRDAAATQMAPDQEYKPLYEDNPAPRTGAQSSS